MRPQLLLLLAVTRLCAADNAVDIVRKSLDLDNRNWQRAKDYTFRETSVQRERDAGGNVKKTESEVHEIFVINGRPVSRLVEKNGKPLAGKELAKEDEKFDREVAKRRRETDEENSRERKKYEERRARQRKFADEIPAAFDFKIAGEELVGGHPAWIIDATPKPGFKPNDDRAKFLPKIKARLWIDKQEYQWVKVQAETTEAITFGLFLARLGPGATLQFEQKRINDEVWLPSRADIRLDARALFKKLRGDIEVTYTDYKKFQTETKITIAEAPDRD